MEIVKISWMDATSPCPGMGPLEEMKQIKPVPVESVGYLLVDDEEKVSLVMSQSEEDHGCDLLIVPRGMVVSMVRLVPTEPSYDYIPWGNPTGDKEPTVFKFWPHWLSASGRTEFPPAYRPTGKDETAAGCEAKEIQHPPRTASCFTIDSSSTYTPPTRNLHNLVGC